MHIDFATSRFTGDINNLTQNTKENSVTKSTISSIILLVIHGSCISDASFLSREPEHFPSLEAQTLNGSVYINIKGRGLILALNSCWGVGQR